MSCGLTWADPEKTLYSTHSNYARLFHKMHYTGIAVSIYIYMYTYCHMHITLLAKRSWACILDKCRSDWTDCRHRKGQNSWECKQVRKVPFLHPSVCAFNAIRCLNMHLHMYSLLQAEHIFPRPAMWSNGSWTLIRGQDASFCSRTKITDLQNNAGIRRNFPGI